MPPKIVIIFIADADARATTFGDFLLFLSFFLSSFSLSSWKKFLIDGKVNSITKSSQLLLVMKLRHTTIFHLRNLLSRGLKINQLGPMNGLNGHLCVQLILVCTRCLVEQ